MIIRISKKGYAIFHQQWVYCAMIALFLAVRNLMQISIPNNIIVLVTCLISAIAFINLNKGKEIAYYVFLIPFQSGFSLPAVGLVFAIVMAFKQMKRHLGRIDATIIPLVIIAVLEFFNVMIGNNNYVELMCLFTFILFMYLSMVEINDYLWDKEIIKEIVCSYALGCIIASTIILVINAQSVSWDLVLSGTYRVGKTVEYMQFTDYILSYNVNVLADFCLMGISSMIVLIHNNLINKRLLGWSAVAYLVLIGFMTQARAFLLALVLIVLLALIVLRKDWWRYLIPAGVLILVVFYIYINDIIHPLTATINRFFEKDMTTMSGRTVIAQQFNDLMLSDPLRFLTGYGIIDYHYYSLAGSSHNGTQELVLTVGLIGAIALVVWVVSQIKRAFRYTSLKGKERLFSLIPFIVFVFFLQAHQFLSIYYHMCFLVICILCCRLDNSPLKQCKVGINDNR